SIDDITSDPSRRARLAAAYSDVSLIDAWVGGLSEDPLPGSHVGLLIHTVVKEQFEALRDGDRFWYQRTLSPAERDDVERTRLSDIIRRNTGIGSELPDDMFHVR
ncbi:MAG: peroxidase family protein, partial [Planctomycetota bacterium]